MSCKIKYLNLVLFLIIVDEFVFYLLTHIVLDLFDYMYAWSFLFDLWICFMYKNMSDIQYSL